MTVATLGELGALVDGHVRGAPEICIANALPLHDVSGDRCITLVDKILSADVLLNNRAVAAVVPLGFPASQIPVIEVRHPHSAFEKIVKHFRPSTSDRFQGVHVHAQIHPTATIGRGCVIAAGVTIGANCVIGDRAIIHNGVHIMANCTLAEDCELYPGVVLYSDTRIGARCLIHAGSVLGAFGFGYRNVNGKHERTAQVGWVEIGDDVELGACVTIDRGTYGATRIGEGSKLDNQVMIAHNCQIGRHNLICAQVGIAGSSTTGDFVVLAGQVGVRDHVHLGDRVTVAAQSGVINDIPSGEVWAGCPAMLTKKHMLNVASLSRLPEMRSELRRLERETQQMQQQLQQLGDLIAANAASQNPDQRAA